MKIIALILSTLTMSYLTVDYFIEQQSANQKIQSDVVVKSVIPMSIAKEQLAVEKSWFKLKLDRAKPVAPAVVKKPKKNDKKDILALGNDKYFLYGIFNAQSEKSKAFILVKSLESNSSESTSEKTGLLKVMQGTELSAGIILKSVTTNTISFLRNGELIEFKLFEAKS